MIRTFICIVICVFLTGTVYGQFPSYPFNRIDLGTQTDNNKYLIWVDDAAPIYTPVADTNAYVSIDTLAGVWYYYRVDSAKWLSLASGGSGSTELADGVTILGDGSTGNEFRADTALIATQSYVNANDDTGTDSQTLTFTDPNLSISGGNSQDISGVNYWDISGSNVYRSSGNVGINTSSPTSKLEVKGSIGITGGVFGDQQDAAFELGSGRTLDGNAYIDLVSDASNYSDFGDRWIRFKTGISRFEHRGNTVMAFKAADNGEIQFTQQLDKVNMHIEGGAGLVGINTSSPAEQLHVSGGSIRMANGSEAAGSVVISDVNGTMSHTTTPESIGAFTGWDTNASDDITNVTVGDGLDVTGTSTKDIDLDFGELETVTTVNGNDEFVMRTQYNAAGSLIATNAQVNVQDLLINTLNGGTDISVTANGTGLVDIDYTGSGGGGGVNSVSAGDLIDVSGTSDVTVSVDFGEAFTQTSINGSDFVMLDAGLTDVNSKMTVENFVQEVNEQAEGVYRISNGTDWSVTNMTSNLHIKHHYIAIYLTSSATSNGEVNLPTAASTYAGTHLYVTLFDDDGSGNDGIINGNTSDIWNASTGSYVTNYNMTLNGNGQVHLYCAFDPNASSGYRWILMPN